MEIFMGAMIALDRVPPGRFARYTGGAPTPFPPRPHAEPRMSGNTYGKLSHRHHRRRKPRPGAGRHALGAPRAGTVRPGPVTRPRPAQARHQPAHHPAPGSRRGGDSFRGVRGQDHRHADRPADPQHRPEVQGLLTRSRTCSARPMPTTPTTTSTACATNAAAAVPRRARPPCAWPPGYRQEIPGGPGHPGARLLSQLGPIEIPFRSWDSVEQNAFFSPRPGQCRSWRPTWTNCAATRIRSGRRSPWLPKACRRAWRADLRPPDAELAHALMSINAVKGVEIGAGFASIAQRGTEHRDELTARFPVEQCRRHPSRRDLLRPADRRPPGAGSRPPASPLPALDRYRRRAGGHDHQGAVTTRASASAPRRSPRR